MEQNLCFEFLKNIMWNAFQTEAIYVKTPYDYTSNIPPEIMQIIWPNISSADTRIAPSAQTPNRRLFVIKTGLQFYTILFYVNLDELPASIVIGPFRSDDFSLNDFEEFLTNIPSLKSMHSNFYNYYGNLPCVSLENIVNTAAYIINTCMFSAQKITPIYVDFPLITDNLFDLPAVADNLTKQGVEQMLEQLSNIRNHMLNGNVETTKNAMKLLLTETKLLSQTDFGICKRNLHMLNHYFWINVLNTHIKHLESTKLYTMLLQKIDTIQTHDALIKMAYDLCYTYCMLFQNNTFPEYSKTISEIINYIHLHLHEPLTLSLIAEHFEKNASTLSYSFKKNTGTTITNYINEARINRAMDYLHNKTFAISEIALATGFQDFAYFSRVFKKHTGYSPSEYRELHAND